MAKDGKDVPGRCSYCCYFVTGAACQEKGLSRKSSFFIEENKRKYARKQAWRNVP